MDNITYQQFCNELFNNLLKSSDAHVVAYTDPIDS